ncbi:choice-of-anchor tandem repeat GloVer-containing protein [Chlamydiota bacterium]
MVRFKKKTNTYLVYYLILFLLLFSHSSIDADEIEKFFDANTINGHSPRDTLIVVDDMFYGMTYDTEVLTGPGDGMIYRFDPNDTTDYDILHTFDAGGVAEDDGRFPFGSLTYYNGKLYGATSEGGTANIGTVFSINTDGSGYEILHHFTGGVSGGDTPYHTNTLVYDERLYGVTGYGGQYNRGALFSMTLTGDDFVVEHSFDRFDADNASMPLGELIEYNDKLYGISRHGGVLATGGVGSIYEFDPVTDTFRILHQFERYGTGDAYGGQPDGHLIEFDGVLYGKTGVNYSDKYAVLFKYELATDTYSHLYTFFRDNTEFDEGWEVQYGGLIMHQSMLYGMTFAGGSYDSGVIFAYDPTRDLYEIVYDFNKLAAEENDRMGNPYATLLLYNEKLYGTFSDDTGFGGGVFGYTPDPPIPEPSTLLLFLFGGSGLWLRKKKRKRK